MTNKSTPKLRIQTLGRFRLWRDGQPLEVWDDELSETVIKLLLAHQAHSGTEMELPAAKLATKLWMDTDKKSGHKKLLPIINNARHMLEPDIDKFEDSNFILNGANGGWVFNLNGAISWDLLKFREHLKRGRQLFQAEKYIEAVAELEKGRVIYQGDFLLEDRYSKWIFDIQYEIANDFRDLLINLADLYALLKDYTKATQTCEEALLKAPLTENIYSRLIRFHYCAGEKKQAVKSYRNCLKLFEELFGKTINFTTHQLYQDIIDDKEINCLPQQQYPPSF